MRHKILTTTILVLGLVAMATLATAQESQVIHFQGLLTGPDGGPLRTDIYDVNFSIWDQQSGGVDPVWSELQVVEVTEGLFDVFLGSVSALSADVFTHAEGESDLRYLEIEVVGDGPMTPRTQIAKTPNSFVSSRVLGDVVTGPGSLKLMEPADDKVGFDVFTGGEGNSLKLMDPFDDEMAGLEMMVDGNGSNFNVKLASPPDDQMPGVEIMTSSTGPAGNQASFRMFNPQPEPPAELLLEMNTTQYGANIAMAAPGAGGLRNEITDPMFEVNVDTSGSSLKMMDPADPEIVGLDMVVDSSGPRFRAWFPQIPGQIPGVEIMTSSTDPGGNEASFRMFNPQPEPPAEPLLEMNTTQYGANLAMAAPGAGGLRDEITDPMFEVNVDSDGGSLNMNDEIGKYMGFEPSPFTDGGFLHMYDPVTDNTMVSLGSNGHITAHNGTFGSNTNTGTYSLAVGDDNTASGDNCFAGGRVAEANHDNCFVWSDYPLGPSVIPTETSGDNQFLVRSTGGAAFFSNANLTSGVALAPGASSWSSIIPPGPDLNTRPVDGHQILTKIGQLPIKYYSHKDQENGAEHIGPMAQDFYALFGLGEDDRHIFTLDPSGVALAGVKALLERIEQLEARIAELEAERR